MRRTLPIPSIARLNFSFSTRLPSDREINQQWRANASDEKTVIFPDVLKTIDMMVEYTVKCIKYELQATEEPIEDYYVTSLESMLHAFARDKDNGTVLGMFLSSYQLQQTKNPGQPHHGPLIELLSSILSISGGDLEMQICTRLLAVFALSEQNLNLMEELSVPPYLLGCLTCHSASVRTRCSCIRVLAQVATVKRPISNRMVLKQSCLDILTINMQEYCDTPELLRLILQTLANMATTSFDCSEDILTKTEFPFELRQSCLENHLSILEQIQQVLIPMVKSILQNFPKDLGIQIEGHRLMNFFKVEEDSLNKIRTSYENMENKNLAPILKPPGDATREEEEVNKTKDRKRVNFRMEIVSETFYYFKEVEDANEQENEVESDWSLPTSSSSQIEQNQ